MPYESRQNSKLPFIHTEYDQSYSSSTLSSAPSSPQYLHSMFSAQQSYNSTPASSLSLDHDDMDDEEEDDDDDDMVFPSYDQPSQRKPSPACDPNANIQSGLESSRSVTPSGDEAADLSSTVNDDHAVEPEPTRHVDYLSHEWREEDIWSSWRYIVARRKTINNSVRLENAAWRTWMKAKYSLRTITPESLNWLKDCDVTWLYGPLQVDTRKSLSGVHSPPPSHLSTSSSFLCKKPILKKKSASAAILERSRSQQSLLQRASEIIRVQQASPAHSRPSLRRTGTDFTLPSFTGSSVANTPAEHDTSSTRTLSFPEPPTPSESKHVLFNEEVRQVQAIDSEDDEKDDQVEEVISESDEDDDGGLMMAPSRSKGSGRSTPRNSFSNENKTIIPLPSTTLKYRTDTPEPQPKQSASFWSHGNKLSPSPSQETLRPTRPSHNFLIDDDAEISDEPWQSQGLGYSPYDDEDDPPPNMRRTESGMFMPYDENEEEAAMNNSLFGQAVYAVNTFKDIAHVVWNVGWNRK